MAKVYLRKDVKIDIPEAAYEYARRLEKYANDMLNASPPNPTRRYRKKQHVINAFLMTRDMEIITLEGTMRGKAGEHYLVIGTKGEQYPVHKDIFEDVYELVNNEEEK